MLTYMQVVWEAYLSKLALRWAESVSDCRKKGESESMKNRAERLAQESSTAWECCGLDRVCFWWENKGNKDPRHGWL